MKGCLKSPLPSPCIARKCVAFSEEGSEEVHLADEWDRTPMEPARKLSYFDFLELREILRSLPKANQIRDPSRKPFQEYLCKVPVGLLPLLPDCSTADSATSSAEPSPQSPSFPSHTPPPMQQASTLPQTQPRPRTYLTHLTSAPVPRRTKPTFTFLPLIDTSTSPSAPFSSPADDNDELHDPPTPSLSHDSESSRASSTSPDHLASYQIYNQSYTSSGRPTHDSTSYFPSFSDPHVSLFDDTPPFQHSPQDSLNPQTPISSPFSPFVTTTEAREEPVQTPTETHGSTQDGEPQDSSSRLQFPSSDSDNDEAKNTALPPADSAPPPVPSINVSPSPSSPDSKLPLDQKRAPPPPFERERDHLCPPKPSDARRAPSRICAKDFRPPSPMGPYCVPRRRRAGPCPSPAMVSSPWCG